MTEVKAREVFFHPRQSARRLNDAESEVRSLRATLAETQDALIASRARVTECETDCARFESTVASLLDQMATLRSELDAERAFTDDIEELNRRCEQLKNMRDTYERRISSLKTALREAREQQRAQQIDMTSPPVAETSTLISNQELPGHEDDWLLPLS